jgi:hypothetical protein
MHALIQVMPCYIRTYFLDMHDILPFENTTFEATLKTKDEFSFNVELTNSDGITYVNGESWKELGRVYQFKVGIELIFKTDTRTRQTEVKIGNDPIIHPCKFPT